MSAYDELVERCAARLDGANTAQQDARYVLAEVLRTLETATPEMRDAGAAAHRWGDFGRVFNAMLRASPLAPPVQS